MVRGRDRAKWRITRATHGPSRSRSLISRTASENAHRSLIEYLFFGAANCSAKNICAMRRRYRFPELYPEVGEIELT